MGRTLLNPAERNAMYKSTKKTNRFTTDIDDFDAEAINEVIALMGIKRAKFVRLALLNLVEQYHEVKSIGREPIQQYITECRRRA